MVQLQINKGLAEVILKRADARNAFHPQMISEVTKAFQKISQNKDIRAVVLRGEGKVFCAGADLQWMKDMAKFTLEENQKDSEILFEMFQALYDCPVPLVTLVQGAAFGGALGLIACSDFVIAEANAKLCFSEVRIGIIPAVISTFVLHRCGRGAVSPWMMSGQEFSPENALRMGLVQEIVPVGGLEVCLQSYLKGIFEAAPEAVRETKQLLRLVARSAKPTDDKAITTQAIAQKRVSREGQEGLLAFLEKRTPSWKCNVPAAQGEKE